MWFPCPYSRSQEMKWPNGSVDEDKVSSSHLGNDGADITMDNDAFEILPVCSSDMHYRSQPFPWARVTCRVRLDPSRRVSTSIKLQAQPGSTLQSSTPRYAHAAPRRRSLARWFTSSRSTGLALRSRANTPRSDRTALCDATGWNTIPLRAEKYILSGWRISPIQWLAHYQHKNNGQFIATEYLIQALTT
jgi:hypothetical protein